MSEKPPAAQRWWQTVPGILTGLAAIITAVTGLLVVLNRTGNRGEDVRPSPQPVSAGAPAASPAQPRSPGAVGAAGGTQPVALPAVSRVRLAGGAADTTIVSAQIEPIDLGRRSLKLVVRYMNAGRYPANFWSSSYRLIVDGVPRAPTNLLDEVVEPDSAKEGDVVFELPLAAKDVVLQISSGEEKSRIPLKLP